MHIQDLSLGTAFEGPDGELYRVISNFSDQHKIYVELAQVIKKIKESEHI